MANEQHITLLRQGFKVWNRWRQRNPQSIPELKGADLRGLKLFEINLSGVDISEADFSGTSLFGANLSSANLFRANLSTAILQETDFSGASLIEANLKGKKLPQTNFSNANLSRANLSGAKLSAAYFSKTNFSLTNLSGADFSGLDLVSNTFTGANLSKANLCSVNLSGTNLTSTDLRSANLCKANLNAANLSGANLSEANLEYTNLRQAQIQEAIIDEKWYIVWDILNNDADERYLQGIDLSMADLTGANLCGAILSDVKLRGTKLNKANLSMANLRKADLFEADLRGACLSRANLSEANLRYTKLHHTQIQEAIIDEKWYIVWDILNNSAEGRNFSEADFSEADLSEAIFKNGNFSRADFSRSILSGADFSWTDLSRANLSKANLTRANFNWADLSKADFSEVLEFGSITCMGANFSGTSFRNTEILSDSLNDFQEEGANFNEAKLDEANIIICCHGIAPVQDKKEFFENLLSWKNQEDFNELIKNSLSSSTQSFIPGIFLYTDEDDKLSLYIREHFDALDKLTGDWCTIYLLEHPSPKWRQANNNWKQRIESSLNPRWFKSKPYDKSEAYDIARQLNVESSNIPCLVLISPTNLSEKLVLQIKEVSPDYFRKLFSTLEKLVKSVSSKGLKQKESSSQVFDHLKINFNQIVNFLEKHASKEEENASTKYILKGDNIFVSIEPVNIGNVNYNEKIEGNYIQGDYTDQSRSLTVGDVGGDFKPTGSALVADGFKVSGVVAESINFDQDMLKVDELQEQQDKKSLSNTYKPDEFKSTSKVVAVVVVFALITALAAYIFFQSSSSNHPESRPSQEQKIKEQPVQ
ncbi:pentapeptide repeat-containing protein [Nostoc flagelliforme FACHB-838]|uniref:Pentapeptide repeat-containing protein n=1 Tax=Nostoc flagelliforme FACHB-838 TaxID=2692904 RepID=A0ABR8DUY7_9NOSO|nr:pentapeptide repeat-containing protein [Nostoc flagelliforme]MBD2533014.1 pentapeptide repeat-containing protein [Nostoc flagelliforme FACHB-838]